MMVYTEIKKGYNGVRVLGDTDRVKVIVIRSGTDISTTVISRHPGIIERLSQGIPLLVPMASEEQFRNRIKKAVKKALNLAHSNDLTDATAAAHAAYMRTYNERQNITLNDFVSTLKDDSDGGKEE